MAVRPQYLAYVLEQLEGVAGLRSRRMFSGVGLYSGDLFFGLIHDDTLFFKTDGSTSADYIARGMPRFMPFPTRPEAVLAYHQVPADIIEDGEALRDLGAKIRGGGADVAGGQDAPEGSGESAAQAGEEARENPPHQTPQEDLSVCLHARLRGTYEIGQRLDRRRACGAPTYIGAGDGAGLLVDQGSIETREIRRYREHQPMRRVQLAEFPLPGTRVGGLANDHDFRRVQIFIQRFEQAHVAVRVAIDREPAGAQCALGSGEPARLA